MNALIHNTYWYEKDKNLTPVQELRLFIMNQLKPLKIKVLEIGGWNRVFNQDINPCDAIIKEIEFIETMWWALHYDDIMQPALLDAIFNKLDFIVDTYIEVENNTEVLREALRKLKAKLSIEAESKLIKIESPTGNVIKLEDHRNKLANQKQRYDALEGVVFSEEGFSSLQAQDRVLGRLQRVIQGSSANQSDIGRIQSDIDSLQHMYRNFDPRWDSREELLRDIITADISKNADLAQRISMFIRVRSAEKRNYTATQEASPMFERHIDNLRERHPIIINTLEYGNVAITHIKKMYYEWAKWEYYKVRTQDKNWVKKDILLRTDNAVVWDLSRKYLWEFDSQGKLVSTNNTFTILSIQSDKIQHKKVELTFGQKVWKTLSSIKNKVSWIFKTQQ